MLSIKIYIHSFEFHQHENTRVVRSRDGTFGRSSKEFERGLLDPLFGGGRSQTTAHRSIYHAEKVTSAHGKSTQPFRKVLDKCS